MLCSQCLQEPTGHCNLTLHCFFIHTEIFFFFIPLLFPSFLRFFFPLCPSIGMILLSKIWHGRQVSSSIVFICKALKILHNVSSTDTSTFIVFLSSLTFFNIGNLSIHYSLKTKYFYVSISCLFYFCLKCHLHFGIILYIQIHKSSYSLKFSVFFSMKLSLIL